ncbi:MAG TPA: Sua5 family C-terminal domain-containing protein, partial [Candidatus Melainabacteria bacterium]|nr:Sua5 family C-terminal domain-containing protein [Candidatus Melainabacteria bacterium]
VRLVNSADINKLIDEFESQGYATAVLSFKPPAMLHRHWITAKSFPSHYAHTLYRNLRKLDAANADIIIVEEPPLNSDWVGIWDRIRRAASETGPTKSMDSEKENGDGA